MMNTDYALISKEMTVLFENPVQYTMDDDVLVISKIEDGEVVLRIRIENKKIIMYSNHSEMDGWVNNIHVLVIHREPGGGITSVVHKFSRAMDFISMSRMLLEVE